MHPRSAQRQRPRPRWCRPSPAQRGKGGAAQCGSTRRARLGRRRYRGPAGALVCAGNAHGIAEKGAVVGRSASSVMRAVFLSSTAASRAASKPACRSRPCSAPHRPPRAYAAQTERPSRHQQCRSRHGLAVKVHGRLLFGIFQEYLRCPFGMDVGAEWGQTALRITRRRSVVYLYILKVEYTINKAPSQRVTARNLSFFGHLPAEEASAVLPVQRTSQGGQELGLVGGAEGAVQQRAGPPPAGGASCRPRGPAGSAQRPHRWQRRPGRRPWHHRPS